MNKSNFLAKKIIDHVLAGVPYTAPAQVDFALFTVAPTAAGGGTEVSGNGYSRKRVSVGGSTFPAATSTGELTTGAAIDFDPADGGNWGTIVAVAIFDTSGNQLFQGALTSSKVINDGESFSFRAGDVVFDES